MKEKQDHFDAAWIRANAHPIKSIDPSQINFEDLSPLKAAVADSKIVLLGEAEHGDGSTFLLKSRLVKYLHEELGFEVLAFESPFYGTNRAWEKYLKKEIAFDGVKEHLYNMWRESAACEDVFRYVEQSQNSNTPLLLAGIDSRHVGDISAAKHIDSLVRTYKLDISKTELDFFNKTLNTVLIREYKDSVSVPDEQRFFATLEKIENALSRTSVDKFWLQEIDNLRAYAMHAWHCVVDEEKEFYNNSNRDRQMADNVIWLLNEKYKGKKIIVWAANMHVVKNYSVIDTTIFPKEEINTRGAEHSLGEYLTNDKHDLCSFITIAHGGKGADFEFNAYPMDTVHRNSVESWFHQVGYPYAFVTLKGNPNAPATGKAILNSGFYGHAANVDLKSTCDVIFYIDQMQPNTRASQK